MSTDLIARTPAELAGRTETLLLAPARHAGYDLPVIGTSQAPEGEFVWQAPNGQHWIFNDHKDDPTAAQFGGVVVPDDVQERLVQLLKHGFAPDIILIGHELPASYSPGEPLPELVPVKPLELVPLKPPAISPQTTETALTVGKASLKAMKMIVAAAVAAGTSIGAAVTKLDPIVIAGVRDPQTGAVTWCEVARWAW